MRRTLALVRFHAPKALKSMSTIRLEIREIREIVIHVFRKVS